jgi:hypothetical protein
MANFQDSRFLGFSSRTLWISLGVLAVVVGLFFIPKAIQFKFSPRATQTAAQRSYSSTAPAPAAKVKAPVAVPQDDQRAALAPGVLREISEDLDEQVVKKPESKQKQKMAEPDAGGGSRGGFFSGWNIRVKARTDNAPKDAPKGVAMDTLGTREAASFFKRGRSDLSRFLDRNKIRDVGVREAVQALLSNVDLVANGIGKNVDPADVSSALAKQHIEVIRSLQNAGLDRGSLLEWLDLSIIRVLDAGRSGGVTRQLQNAFSPRIVLRNVSVRQRGAGDADGRVNVSMSAEVAVQGSDVAVIGIYRSGQLIREVHPSRPDADGFRSFRINGDGSGVWGFMAHDKYGSATFAKTYSFYPRVRRFRLADDGTFEIGFRAGSARNSLDRYFAVATAGSGTRKSSDPSVTVF